MIIKDYSSEVENFEEFLKDKLEAINEVAGRESILFKKILYVSFIDSLAACVYPGRSNKERFLSLVEQFSRWDDRDRVSLPHLGKFVSLTPDPTLEKMRAYVMLELKPWPQKRGKCIPISEDPKYDQLKGFDWDKKILGVDESISLSDFKHTALLYQLRNSLVHQFQPRFSEWQPPSSPYYERVSGMDESHKINPIKIELVYPTEFLKTLSSTIFSHVIQYFKDGNINPFPHYYAGDNWINALNR